MSNLTDFIGGGPLPTTAPATPATGVTVTVGGGTDQTIQSPAEFFDGVRATATQSGTVRVRLNGTTGYITSDGNDA